MGVFKCKICGGSIEFAENSTIGICDSCGTKQTLPKLSNERVANLYDIASHFRRNNEFDKATRIYEQILEENTDDAEVYWSLVLCHYGIEYVEEPLTHKRVPTVNRTQFTSIFDDDNYQMALKYGDAYQCDLYVKEAEKINEIQKEILEISLKEKPFDIFICYKETDEKGRRTPDSVLANDLYYQLTQAGYKVFFSRITLEDKLGTAYEPYIFAALNSAKVMVVIGTKPEYFNSAWVKNEWSRYLLLVRDSKGKKVLIPAYKGMDPYDLPIEFSHLQAQDLDRLGFMQDLLRGIRKIIKPETAQEPVAMNSGINVHALVRRIFMFIDDSEWSNANEYCERVLDQEPENVQAYLGKLLVDKKVRSIEELRNCELPFDDDSNYKKIERFGSYELVEKLKSTNKMIRERNEEERCRRIYVKAKEYVKEAVFSKQVHVATEMFESIRGYKNSGQLADACRQREFMIQNVERKYSEGLRKEGEGARLAQLFAETKSIETAANAIEYYEKAVEDYRVIQGWNNIQQRIAALENIITLIEDKAKEERAKRKKRRLRLTAVISIIVIWVALWISLIKHNIVNPGEGVVIMVVVIFFGIVVKQLSARC